MAGDVVSDMKSWQSLQERATQAIDRVHRTRPGQKGIDLTELRAELPGISAEVVDALVTNLCLNGFVRHGSALGRLSHRAALPPALDRTAKQILAALMEKPLDPPARNRVAPDADHQQVVGYLIENGDVVDLGANVLLSGEAFASARERVIRFIASNGSGSVSQLREALETSRRVAVPLLERLDRDRVTRRLGDRRVLVEKQHGNG
jgi:selenocysteine-specific elongation factor